MLPPLFKEHPSIFSRMPILTNTTIRTNNPSIFELNRKAKKARYSIDPNTRQGLKKNYMAQNSSHLVRESQRDGVYA